MPYIEPNDADRVDQHGPSTGAELNYAICKMIAGFLEQRPIRYRYLAEVIAALEGAKGEVERRILGPYEDEKANESWEGKTVDPFDELRFP